MPKVEGMTFSKMKPEFKVRQDLLSWMFTMFPIDQAYLEESGASYTKEIREIESVLRSFWALIPAYSEDLAALKQEPLFQSFKHFVATQKLPRITTDNRQLAVEIGVLGYCFGKYGAAFLLLFNKKEQEYLITWLNQINQIQFPVGNWYFFLVLINGGLKKAGCSYSEERLNVALAEIEKLYIGEGWYTDGPNFQRDYYVSFAFHFYGLLYSQFCDAELQVRFVKRAVQFSKDFIYWFDPQGRSLPYGRSLTYRFAHVSFWCALVVSDAWRQTGFSLGTIKGIILRNFRFWQKQPINMVKEQNLSIGYGYSNLLLSEDYNAPGSPMWAFKAFVLLELREDHEFWQVVEEPLPTKESLVLQRHAGFHIQSFPEQTIALSSLQYCSNAHLYHHQEKYSKFAYSTYFGFNITRNSEELNDLALDSTLAFSLPGFNQWCTRGPITATRLFKEYGVSQWLVWNQVQVSSYLVPFGEGHVRIHEINTPFTVESAEGGFPLWEWNPKYQQPEFTETSCLLANNWGYTSMEAYLTPRKAAVSAQGPNSNLYSCEKNGIPMLTTTLSPGRHVLAAYVVGSVSDKPKHKNLKIREKKDSFVILTDQKKIEIKKERFDV
ncbi:DUF2264 domain-containing protein [Enterococcus faecium]|uniref:DUF2264 domain-containing protein n=1 Tax=Enterococcus faecium TaxID=1352 RepID=UPI0023B26885|nr:DUF2264 domain-containing protein [Enterococcus faecium]